MEMEKKMKVKTTQIKNCRGCGSSNLKKILTIFNMPLTDDLRTKKNKGTEFLDDIEVFICQDCGLTQLINEFDFSDYYNNYGYTSSNSGFSQNYMKRLVSELYLKFGFKKECKVIEVGSGDGTQLSFFKQYGARVYGIEPSKALCETSRKNGIPVYHGFFNNNTIQFLPEEFKRTNIVLLTYTFDHMPNPNEILNSVGELLDSDAGVLVIEIHDLDKIISRKEFCLFAHEHYIYMTKNTLANQLRKNGFEPITFELLPDNQKRGNSLLVVAKPIKNSQVSQKVDNTSKIIQLEMEKTNTLESDINKAILNLDDFIDKIVKSGKKIAGYGAGGRGVMTLAALTKSKHIKYVCDQNESFHGYYTPKSNIEIVSPRELKEKPVDILLVFSFGYLNEIVAQVSEFNPNMKIISILEIINGEH